MKKLCLIGLIALSACAQPVWFKAGSTTSDFGADKYSCMQGSLTAAPAVAGVNAYGNSYGNSGSFAAKTQDINAGTRDQMFTACMQAKGWSLAKASDNPFKKQWLAEISTCKQKHESGTYKTFLEFAVCTNQANERYAKASNYQPMDQMYAFDAARSQLATQVDEGKITEAEFDEQMKSKGAEMLHPSN